MDFLLVKNKLLFFFVKEKQWPLWASTCLRVVRTYYVNAETGEAAAVVTAMDIYRPQRDTESDTDTKHNKLEGFLTC